MARAVRRPVKLDWRTRFIKYFAYGLVGAYTFAMFYGFFIGDGWGILLALVGPVVVPFIYGLVGVLLGFPAIDVSPPNTGGGCDPNAFENELSPTCNYVMYSFLLEDNNNDDP